MRFQTAVLPMSKKFRYGFFIYSSAFSIASYRVISSSGFSLFHRYLCSSPSNSSILSTIINGSDSFINSLDSGRCNNHFLRYNLKSPLFSTSCFHSSAHLLYHENHSINRMIINLIENDGIGMESNLFKLVSNLSKSSIIVILQQLNFSKVPALRFFAWLKDVYPLHCRNADICSLVFANCGLLGNYEAMLNLLKTFRDQQICLSEKAFGFLPISSIDMDSAQKFIAEIVRLLNEVGGSCCNSGMHSLVKMLCSSNSIDLARYVIEISERKVSYYCILVKHMCTRNQFEDARKLVEEMWQIECDPDSKVYNHLISYLCNRGRIDEALSILQEMLNPDMLTFETLIHFSCRYGCLDQADMLYNQMVSRGLQPHLSTHYAYIRGCFHGQQFEEAYRYVKIKAAKDKSVARDIYSLLANLHINDGNLLVAHDLIADLLGKGLKPKHSMFIRATKRLCQSGKSDFAESLRAQYERLNGRFI